MTKEERGALFVEREELEAKQASMFSNFNERAKVYNHLHRTLVSSPEKLTFSGAPNDLGSIPIELMRQYSLPWSDYPPLEVIAREVIEYRAVLKRIARIEELLA